MAENEKKSAAELLKEELVYQTKNSGEVLSDKELEKADLFCEG